MHENRSEQDGAEGCRRAGAGHKAAAGHRSREDTGERVPSDRQLRVRPAQHGTGGQQRRHPPGVVHDEVRLDPRPIDGRTHVGHVAEKHERQYNVDTPRSYTRGWWCGGSSPTEICFKHLLFFRLDE